MIDENNYPHIGLLVVLFQKSSTVQFIFMPSISDMPLLYSISSLKSMTDMCGSSNFRLRWGRGGGGGAGQNLTGKKTLSTFWSSNLSTVGSSSSTC